MVHPAATERIIGKDSSSAQPIISSIVIIVHSSYGYRLTQFDIFQRVFHSFVHLTVTTKSTEIQQRRLAWIRLQERPGTALKRDALQSEKNTVIYSLDVMFSSTTLMIVF
jgi:hypothetical protein